MTQATLDREIVPFHQFFLYFLENATQYPSFSEKQIFALRCLTLASIANESENQVIQTTYSTYHTNGFDRLIDWLIDRYVIWLIDCLADWLMD